MDTVKDITSIAKYTELGWSRAIREDFNLDFATDSQISALHTIFSGMKRYDKSYGDDKLPFEIEQLKINRVTVNDTEETKALRKSLGLKEKKTIQVSIITSPQTDSKWIKVEDTKYRSFLLGTKGGFYTYTSKGEKRYITEFEAEYGMRFGKAFK